MCRPQIAGKRHMECAYYFLKSVPFGVSSSVVNNDRCKTGGLTPRRSPEPHTTTR